MAVAMAAGQVKPDPAETVRFLRQSWALVKREGPVAVERIERWPAEVKQVRARVESFAKRQIQADPKTMQERAILLSELWRIRGSLNLLALLSPDRLKDVAGLDAKQLRELAEQVQSMRI